MKSSHHIDTPAAGDKDGTLYVAFELSKSKWLIGIVVSGESKMSRHVVAGGDTAAVWQLISKKRAQAEKKLGRPVRVVSCYEAGFDGFWLDRWLAEQGIENRVLDPSSIELPRRARQAKTDRLDLERLMRVLIRHEGGEPRVCSVVRPPSPEQEDARRLSRERDRLVGERTAHGNRIKGLLHGQGVRDVEPRRKDFREQLARACTGDGRALPPRLVAEIVREHDRLMLIAGQLAEVEGLMKAEREAAVPDSRARQVNQLIELKSIGPVGGETLANEVFWRDFQQPAPGRGVLRPGRHAVRQRRELARAGHQQVGQLPRPHPGDRAGLAVAALSARQRAEPVVQSSASATRRAASSASPSSPWRAS